MAKLCSSRIYLTRLLTKVEPASTKGQPESGPALSEREEEVLQAIARGDRSKEIALQLGISERTVKAHLANIYSKLGVDSRAAAVAVAAKKGMLNNSNID